MTHCGWRAVDSGGRIGKHLLVVKRGGIMGVGKCGRALDRGHGQLTAGGGILSGQHWVAQREHLSRTLTVMTRGRRAGHHHVTGNVGGGIGSNDWR